MNKIETQHDIIRVVGEGAKDFLQGQLSADINSAAINKTDSENIDSQIQPYLPSLLLSPEGKLVAALKVIPISEGYILEVASGYGQAAKDRLQRFFIGARSEMSLETCRGVSVAIDKSQDSAPSDLSSLFDGDPKIILEENWSENIVCLRALYLGEVGTQTEANTLEYYSFEYYRVLSGVAKMGAELYEGLIPAGVGQKFIDQHISFTKGCFVGQELSARIDSRGSNTPQKLVRLLIDGLIDEEASEISDLQQDLQQGNSRGLFLDGKSVGLLTSLVESQQNETAGQFIALAYLKRGLMDEKELVLEVQNSLKTLKVKILN